MDVTKLFDLPSDKMEPLPDDRLDAMITAAIAAPQIKRATRQPANQNRQDMRKFIAYAAAIILVIAAGVQLYPMNVTTGTQTSAISDETFDEVSDLLIMETFTVSSVE